LNRLFYLPLPANPHVSLETWRGHKLHRGFTGFNSNINQRRFIMAVQCASFQIGRVVITPNALGQLTPADIQLGLQRHQAGDWGNLGEEDWQENDQALHAGRRLLSSYRSDGGVPFWIITEADRSVTTLLLPDDY
jgi:hypothetical protein